MENVTKDVPMNGYLVALDLFEWPYKDDNFEKFKLNYQRPLGFCAVLSQVEAKALEHTSAIIKLLQIQAEIHCLLTQSAQ
jgi:hypothetical protein